MALYEPGSGSTLDTKSAGTLIWIGLQNGEKCLLFKLPGLWHFCYTSLKIGCLEHGQQGVSWVWEMGYCPLNIPYSTKSLTTLSTNSGCQSDSI